MAIKLEGTIRRFIGASTDAKPKPGSFFDGRTLEAADVTAGSSFLETDTGRIYRWDGESWAYPTSGGTSIDSPPTADGMMIALLTEIRDELRRGNELTEAFYHDATS